jgi:hypothetical protein
MRWVFWKNGSEKCEKRVRKTAAATIMTFRPTEQEVCYSMNADPVPAASTDSDLYVVAITREKGLALIPIKIYLKNGRIKCEIAVAKGKKLHDKRETERAKTADAEARAEMRRRA